MWVNNLGGGDDPDAVEKEERASLVSLRKFAHSATSPISKVIAAGPATATLESRI
jgi:hypothetical protein